MTLLAFLTGAFLGFFGFLPAATMGTDIPGAVNHPDVCSCSAGFASLGSTASMCSMACATSGVISVLFLPLGLRFAGLASSGVVSSGSGLAVLIALGNALLSLDFARLAGVLSIAISGLSAIGSRLVSLPFFRLDG